MSPEARERKLVGFKAVSLAVADWENKIFAYVTSRIAR